MAGLLERCTYDCGKYFYSQSDLIKHIEQEHIDFHPKILEGSEAAKPSAVPMSYVLRFSKPSDAPPKFVYDYKKEMEDEVYQKVGYKNKTKNLRLIKEQLKSENEEISELAGNTNLFTLDYSNNKPYACNMPSCTKRYKNLNGVKYHLRNFHNIMYIPTLKKSLLKQHEVSSNSKSIIELESQEIPQYKQPIQNNVAYPNMIHFEGCECMTNESDPFNSPADALLSQVQLGNDQQVQQGNDQQVQLENDNFFSFDEEAVAGIELYSEKSFF